MNMFRRFLADTRANYAIITVVAMVPIMGALAIALDYSEMTRQRQATLNALDAAGVATARRAVEGATDEQLRTYARQFFDANLSAVNPADATLDIVLPSSDVGGGTLKLTARLKYKPWFLPTASMLVGKRTDGPLDFMASAEVRLKNTLEVALVLDNSGSMDFTGGGSGKKRIDLLKEAAKQLVDTIAAQSVQMKQVDKPVQFGIVPFAASVNVGPDNATAGWMDKDGISPVHHESFDWTTLSQSAFPNRYAQKVGSVWYARGSDWGSLRDKPLTRLALYDQLQRVTSQLYNSRLSCAEYYGSSAICRTWNAGYTYTYGRAASWAGCVEARPSPYNTDDTAAVSGTPATMFVPMFAADETDERDSSWRYAEANWWNDGTGGGSLSRQAYMPKYFSPGGLGTSEFGLGSGPNASCTTKPITPLTDVSKTAGLTAVKAAIDAMAPLGATNVPEGMAWGWRVVSGGAPFTEGRPDVEKGNDKVVIVLTDGANTYYTPSSLGYNDLAGNKSTYSAYGYAGRNTPGYSLPRLFQGTPGTISRTDYSNGNYSKAMNAQFDTLCTNAKARNLLVMTVSLDLDSADPAEKAQMDALKACASDSRFRKDAGGAPAKLYWNATGGNLADKFKEIADELSNLRIVG